MVDRILGFIGDYYLKLDGQVDALVFTGGIGEKSAFLRKTLADKCRSLGVAIDAAANTQDLDENQTVKDISQGHGGMGLRVLICQTNEQVRFRILYLLWSFFLSFFLSFSLFVADPKSSPQFEMAYRCVCSRS